MLIVIVIIGILASALIPRLSQARERANDTARKAHIQNIATVLIAYQIDKWSYPDTAWAINSPTLSAALIGAGLSSVPTDPDANRSFLGIGTTPSTCTTSAPWQYMYTPIKKRGISNAWFVLMAGTQTEWWSNWIYQSWENIPNGSGWTNPGNYINNGCMSSDTDFASIIECPTFTNGATDLVLCRYNNQSDVLRYVYKQ
jgi:type II secretory pathway pseudopilin PulG